LLAFPPLPHPPPSGRAPQSPHFWNFSPTALPLFYARQHRPLLPPQFFFSHPLQCFFWLRSTDFFSTSIFGGAFPALWCGHPFFFFKVLTPPPSTPVFFMTFYGACGTRTCFFTSPGPVFYAKNWVCPMHSLFCLRPFCVFMTFFFPPDGNSKLSTPSYIPHYSDPRPFSMSPLALMGRGRGAVCQ